MYNLMDKYRKVSNTHQVLIFFLRHHKAAHIYMYLAGLEKSSVLPVLDRFLSLKTDFVLNRKQKNRSIQIRFLPVQF